jgi:hypothetical protein
MNVQLATRMEAPLLEAAAEAIQRARAAHADGDVAAQTRASIVAILCSEAALKRSLTRRPRRAGPLGGRRTSAPRLRRSGRDSSTNSLAHAL